MLTFKKPSFYRLAPVSGAAQRLRQDDRRRKDQRHDHRCGEDHVFALSPRTLSRGAAPGRAISTSPKWIWSKRNSVVPSAPI